ncbi:MAG: acyl-CoA dehydratase activase [Candidatus Aminicenantes bacterium]|nr:acyl-CoA dehydratase activase [Candidatus Aminicenantes bacterium]MDH5742922.1 acyl-CoA dehydratase activase [Candidatus Aminicenantes bacterium]
MSHFVGIDVGASTTKAVIIDQKKEVLGHSVVFSGADFQAAADEAFDKASKMAGGRPSKEGTAISTGYGRRNIPFTHSTKTEISCHAKGSFHYYARAHTLIDIGGQDSKIIRIDGSGKRVGFKMNRKCAAGTGAFLEEIANRLKIKIEKLDGLARDSEKDVQIGSYCTVFTATEILTKIRQNVRVEDIIKGIFDSVIKRALEMDPLEGNIVMSGGVVAHNPFLVEMFEQKLGRNVFVPPLPQLTGALGAALYALEDKGG